MVTPQAGINLTVIECTKPKAIECALREASVLILRDIYDNGAPPGSKLGWVHVYPHPVDSDEELVDAPPPVDEELVDAPPPVDEELVDAPPPVEDTSVLDINVPL
jgi:hypothetical protein